MICVDCFVSTDRDGRPSRTGKEMTSEIGKDELKDRSGAGIECPCNFTCWLKQLSILR